MCKHNIGNVTKSAKGACWRDSAVGEKKTTVFNCLLMIKKYWIAWRKTSSFLFKNICLSTDETFKMEKKLWKEIKYSVINYDKFGTNPSLCLAVMFRYYFHFLIPSVEYIHLYKDSSFGRVNNNREKVFIKISNFLNYISRSIMVFMFVFKFCTQTIYLFVILFLWEANVYNSSGWFLTFIIT